VIDERAAGLRSTIAAADTAHRDLESCIRGLEEARQRADSAALARELTILAAALRQHFAHEESSKLYTWVPGAFESQRVVLGGLKAQHAGFLRELEDLRANEDGRAQRLETLVGALRAHEAAEDEALVRALAELG
jgi:hemerythrin